jgi:hypothetical protein
LEAGDRDLESRPVFCGLLMPGTELPLSATGKVKKHVLAQLLEPAAG